MILPPVVKPRREPDPLNDPPIALDYHEQRALATLHLLIERGVIDVPEPPASPLTADGEPELDA